MTRGSGGVDQATRMLEAVPDPEVDDADASPSVREQIRDRRAARALNQSDRRAIFLMVPVMMLLIVGLGAMLSAASVVSFREWGDSLYYVKRQVVWVGLGIVALVVFTRIPYRLYRRFALPIFLLAVAGLVATMVFGDVRGGARRWIEVGPLTIQALSLIHISEPTRQ